MSGNNVIFSTDNFSLITIDSIDTQDRPFKWLKVVSTGDAEKHVVKVDLHCDTYSAIKEAKYQYFEATVNYGLRGKVDSLAETREFIQVLEEAIKFAERVNAWLDANPEWKVNA